ncbi:hypothetical protein RJ641_012928 [Dillenia turbinata]|uniref:Uncharacterized protein n=1 Tax=Dillenia turbinata TaxID=194707 RepID=A0AAN8V334_9MAGN
MGMLVVGLVPGRVGWGVAAAVGPEPVVPFRFRYRRVVRTVLLEPKILVCQEDEPSNRLIMWIKFTIRQNFLFDDLRANESLLWGNMDVRLHSYTSMFTFLYKLHGPLTLPVFVSIWMSCTYSKNGCMTRISKVSKEVVNGACASIDMLEPGTHDC